MSSRGLVPVVVGSTRRARIGRVSALVLALSLSGCLHFGADPVTPCDPVDGSPWLPDGAYAGYCPVAYVRVPDGAIVAERIPRPDAGR